MQTKPRSNGGRPYYTTFYVNLPPNHFKIVQIWSHWPRCKLFLSNVQMVKMSRFRIRLIVKSSTQVNVMTMYKEQLEKSLKNIEDYVSDVDKLYVGKCVMIFSAYWILGIGQCDQYKVAKFLQNCPKIISLEK